MTIFSIILIPYFRKREHILEKYLFIVSPLHKVEFSPTNEIGSGYFGISGYIENVYIFPQSRKSLFTRITVRTVLTLQLLTKLIKAAFITYDISD